MKKKTSFICIILFLSCASPLNNESRVSDARIQYEQYLSAFYAGGDCSNIDSALKYNAILIESDSASIVQYFNQIQLLYLCGRYDSILSFVNRIPQNMLSLTPEFKTFLQFKCKAIMAKESCDAYSYRNYLDSIIIFWEPVVFDSIRKSDSLFSKSIDSIPAHLWFLCDNYYKIISLIYGKDSVEQILSSKRARYNWNSETYTLIKQSTNGNSELSLP